MRDFVAVLLVFLLIAFALSMATSLQWYRRGHTRRRRAIAASGQVLVAEIPMADDLRFFTQDAHAFHWGARTIPKDQIRAARVLISGAPIATCASSRHPPPPATQLQELPSETGSPDGFGRDRWDVAIDLADETILVECGAIRERVSQELARQVFDAVKTDIELRDQS